MRIKLVLPNGVYVVYNHHGELVDCYDPQYGTMDTDGDYIGAVGIWNADTKETTPWSDVVMDMEHGCYQLPAKAYLDNGQVIEEGKILDIMEVE